MSWSPGRRRNVQKLLTFTPEEWEQVDANWTACATDPRYERFADFARAALTRTQIRVIEVPTSPMAIRSEVRRIGININELTHLANRTGTEPPRHRVRFGIASIARGYPRARKTPRVFLLAGVSPCPVVCCECVCNTIW